MSSVSTSKTGLGKNLDKITSLTIELDKFFSSGASRHGSIEHIREQWLAIIAKYNITHRGGYCIGHNQAWLYLDVNEAEIILINRVSYISRYEGYYCIDKIPIKDVEEIKQNIANSDISDDMKEFLLYHLIIWINPRTKVVVENGIANWTNEPPSVEDE